MLDPAFNATDMTFILIATCLVMVITPGLAFFYGGLVGRKNAIAIMMQSFVALGISTIMWVFVGYSLCFSGDVFGIIGNLNNASWLIQLAWGSMRLAQMDLCMEASCSLLKMSHLLPSHRSMRSYNINSK